MKLTTLVATTFLIGFFVIPLPVASADPCSIGEEELACTFSCEGDTNLVSVSGAINSPLLQWRSIAVDASCAARPSAACAGHGHCEGDGGGVYGSGSCVIEVGDGVDATAGCAANACESSARYYVPGVGEVGTSCLFGARNSVEIRVLSTGERSAEFCRNDLCVPTPLVCAEGARLVCGVGVSMEDVRSRAGLT